MAEARAATLPSVSQARSSGVMAGIGCYHVRDYVPNTNVMQADDAITLVSTLAERLKQARTDKEWTQEQLAEKAGVTVP